MLRPRKFRWVYGAAFLSANVVAALLGSFDNSGHAVWTETLWTDVGLVGVYFSGANLYDAWLDLEALNVSGRNGLLRSIAFGNLTEETFRLAKSAVICVVGVAAMATAPTNPRAPVSALSVILTAGIFLLGVLIVSGSAIARHRRRRADLLIEAQRARRRAGAGEG